MIASRLPAASAAEVRSWCLKRFEEWGFSPGEVEFLDKMREQEQKD
jgi:hypothetical protein